jgi:predicted RNA binding protein YcfA (HicA-like mRNA interferase family)
MMGERVVRMTSREIESILRRHGFTLIAQKGSHRKWRNELTKRQTTVPEHKGHVLPLGTLFSIMKAAEIPESEWRR